MYIDERDIPLLSLLLIVLVALVAAVLLMWYELRQWTKNNDLSRTPSPKVKNQYRGILPDSGTDTGQATERGTFKRRSPVYFANHLKKFFHKILVHGEK